MRNHVWMVGIVLAVAGVGCGDDDGDVMPGRDAGMRDAGPPPGDGGPPPDTGPVPDTGPMPDSGPMADAGPSGCPDLAMRDVVMVPAGDITADTTWTCDHIYRLGGQVYVRNTGGGTTTLTIEAGTVVEGLSPAPTSVALVITTTGRIDAQGTATDPIVFTSSKAVADRAPGDWGGVVLLGRARVNFPGGTSTIEGLDPIEARGEFGGTDDAHDCGTIRYARIEYAGFELVAMRELNGLSVGGCGSGTELDYIQVHKGSDDGIEFFGGTAGITHAVITGPGDDGLDWDNGWTGNAQFVIVAQHPGRGDNGIEADNNDPALDATFALMPRSEPTIWNLTMVGQADADGDSGAGARLRRGTGGHIHNAIVMNFKRSGFRLGEVAAQQMAGDLEIRNSIVFNNGMAGAVHFEAGSDAVLAAEFLMPMYMNRVAMDPMLSGASSATDPSFTPPAGSIAATGGGTPGAGFDATATYVGAVPPGSAAPWYAGWTAFP